jgi:hypothetical protein
MKTTYRGCVTIFSLCLIAYALWAFITLEPTYLLDTQVVTLRVVPLDPGGINVLVVLSTNSIYKSVVTWWADVAEVFSDIYAVQRIPRICPKPVWPYRSVLDYSFSSESVLSASDSESSTELSSSGTSDSEKAKCTYPLAIRNDKKKQNQLVKTSKNMNKSKIK